MRLFILVLTLLLPATLVQAYNPISAEPDETYSVIKIEGDPYIERTYLGDLENAPDLYEFTTEVAISVRIQVRQRAYKKAVPFGLIIVRQNDADGGVEEIVRQNEPLLSWRQDRSHSLGMKFLSAPALQIDIKPGTYRLEVSTPDNSGTYALNVGEEAAWPGYFKSVWYALKTQLHFGFTPFHIIFSSYAYVTLAIIGIAYGGYWYRVSRKKKYDYIT